MAKKTQLKAKKIAEDFVKYIRDECSININQAYLFGSYAKNKQHKDSDIDVCIISDDFEKVDGISFLADKRRDEDVMNGIEPIGIATGDFVKFNPIASEVKKYGISVVD